MEASTHFDRRGPSYDADETHRRIVEILLGRAGLQPGMRVLDVATGTGAAALKAAEIVGSQGSVVGIDVSEGMLAEAQRKVAATGVQHVTFLHADAERVEMPAESFDYLLCASALMLMRDIPDALRRWSGWLSRGGCIAFDMPAKPFGLSQMIAEAAAAEGIVLGYDSVTDSSEKCEALLEQAGFEDVVVRREVVSDAWVDVAEAIAFLERRMDHPAWRALRESSGATRDAVRSGYAAGIRKRAVEERVRNEVALNFAYARKPS